jgi:Amt family ammonium transporter
MGIEELFTDTYLESLAAKLASVRLIVHAPSLFADYVYPSPPDSEAAGIHELVHDLLWPMARDKIEHTIMNRVRLKPNAPVLPYRILVAPLEAANHSIGFVAALRTHDQESYGQKELAELTAAIPAVKKYLNERLDSNTGLLRRSAFEAEITRRCRHKNSVCVVYANLDQVHVVNELAGFAAGDQIIRDVARLWQSRLIPRGSIATHLSGDRFAAVLIDHTLNQGRNWAESAREGVLQLESNNAAAKMSASFGVSVLNESESFQHALAAAETACRVAKDRGRNRVELYVTGDQTVMRRHEEVRESRLILDALDHDGFVLHAQPIVSFDDPSNAHHFEILLRIKGADGQLKSIASLLKAAERYQMLERLDRWVLAHVLELLAPAGATLSALGARFSVNITGQSLSQPEFADYVRTEIKSHDIPMGLLDFELTETAAIKNLNATRRFITRVAEIGARVSLDDFGTGLSSLVHLKDLDVHRIKIDGQFVRDVLSNARSRALIRALVQISAEIGLETVAEYVESEGIAASVHELGVQYAQGYFYGRPRPLTDVLAELFTVQSSGGAKGAPTSDVAEARRA